MQPSRLQCHGHAAGCAAAYQRIHEGQGKMVAAHLPQVGGRQLPSCWRGCLFGRLLLLLLAGLLALPWSLCSRLGLCFPSADLRISQPHNQACMCAWLSHADKHPATPATTACMSHIHPRLLCKNERVTFVA